MWTNTYAEASSMCVYRQLLGFRKWTVTSRIQDFSFPSLNAPLVGKTCPTSDFIIKMQREHFIKKCCVNLPYNICALWWFQLACLALFKTCGVKYIITHLKFGLYPKTDSSNVRLGMIENIDVCGCWRERHNWSCSLDTVKISICLYHPEKKP